MMLQILGVFPSSELRLNLNFAGPRDLIFQVKNVVLPQSLQRAMAAEAEAAREAKAKVVFIQILVLL